MKRISIHLAVLSALAFAVRVIAQDWISKSSEGQLLQARTERSRALSDLHAEVKENSALAGEVAGLAAAVRTDVEGLHQDVVQLNDECRPTSPIRPIRPIAFTPDQWDKPAEFSTRRFTFHWDKPVQFGDADGELIADDSRRYVYFPDSTGDRSVKIWFWQKHEDPAMQGKRSEIVMESLVEPGVVKDTNGRWIITIPAEQ